MRKLFTSEAVTNGHPDKVCDQIADAILDELLKQDPFSRCACEVTADSSLVHIMGEITTDADVDYEAVARKVIRDIGYNRPEYGFDDSIAVSVSVHEQSPDIALGVDAPFENRLAAGAGDQGMMFGYANKESSVYMPLGTVLARKLSMSLTAARKDGVLSYLRPDGKSQITVEYDGENPFRISAVVLSAQHDPDVPVKRLREDLMDAVIREVIPEGLLDSDTKFYINPTGRFVYGGPAADSGLTGRKIIADTYGGYAHHGGGAFSGKDPSKVDRTAALMLRHIAKTIVASGLASECELQAAYAIGVAEPVSLNVCTFATGIIDEDKLVSWVLDNFDLRPEAMTEYLELRNPIYLKSAANGPFGWSDETFSWERISPEAVKKLKQFG